MIREYVLGFCFSEDSVLLIKKDRPEWQKGLYNGLGGHVEEGETIAHAMAREFEEEVEGALDPVPEEEWNYVCTFRGEDYMVHTFSTFRHMETFIKKVEEGTICTIGLSLVYKIPIIPNLNWIIPLCRSGSVGEPGKSIIWENMPEKI